ncbi:hypothetical protein [Kaistia granuli]|uniref:hypothetical protein n=1 Tax=Kaistia granuli TaxID=363259 RepID=UPI0018DE32AA|nr:hypothetical protein [Kaistia granuli]
MFDLARERAYRTALLRSSVLQWVNLDRFLLAARIDQLVCAETSGSRWPMISALTTPLPSSSSRLEYY